MLSQADSCVLQGNSGVIRLPLLRLLLLLVFSTPALEALFLGMLFLTFPSGTTVYRLNPTPGAAHHFSH